MLKRFVNVFLLVNLFFTAEAFSHGMPGFTSLIESTSPAVVQIDTTESNLGQIGSRGPQRDIPGIFGEQFKQQEDSNVALAAGSGFIISNDGYVLTNYHVVEGANEITVRLSDRREFEAKIIGVDRRSDLALLKIEAKNLTALEFASASRWQLVCDLCFFVCF